MSSIFSHAWEKRKILVPFWYFHGIRYCSILYAQYTVDITFKQLDVTCPSLSNLIKPRISLSWTWTAQVGWHGFLKIYDTNPSSTCSDSPPPLGPAKWPKGGAKSLDELGMEKGVEVHLAPGHSQKTMKYMAQNRCNNTKCLEQHWHPKLIQTRSKPSSKHDRDRRGHAAPT